MKCGLRRPARRAHTRRPAPEYIEAILKRGLDRQPREAAATWPALVEHESLRGADYYDRRRPSVQVAGTRAQAQPESVLKAEAG
jgi:hypothetical protein